MRQDGGNLFVGTDDAEDIAGEDAPLAAGNADGDRAALDTDDVDAKACTQVAGLEALAHKITARAHGHVGEVQVVYDVLVAARAHQLALIKVVHEARLHVRHRTAHTAAEEQSRQHQQCQCRSHAPGHGVGGGDDVDDDEQGDDGADYRQRHIGYRNPAAGTHDT